MICLRNLCNPGMMKLSHLFVVGLVSAPGLRTPTSAQRPTINTARHIATASAAQLSHQQLHLHPRAPQRHLRRTPLPSMSLFGLGAPELAIIAGVALFVLGPEKVKELAKEAGKVSAELKQVPEEFNKGLEVAEVAEPADGAEKKEESGEDGTPS